MDDDLFTYEDEIPELPYLPSVEKQMDDGNPGVYKRKVCYDESEEIYVKSVIFVNKRLMKYTRLLMLAKQLRKCGKLSKDTDKEIDEQELEANYSYMAKIQEVPTAVTGTDSEPLEQVQNDTGYNVFSNDLQHSEQSESISNTCIVETDDSNVIPDSP
nr:hypothetical protein [Tanacetum cinerariifolium]